MKRRFKKTYIEITNTCNLNCSFCPKTLRKLEFMSTDVFESILKKLLGHSEHLYFHVMGEPLLHPNLSELLDLAGKQNFKVNITTNGVLLDAIKHKFEGKNALRQVNISLHSFEENTLGFTLDQYLNNIFLFVRDFSKEVLISLRLWNLSEHANSKDIEHVTSKDSLYILKRIEDEFRLPYEIIYESSPIRGIKLSENIFLNQAPRFEWPHPEAPFKGLEGFCYGLRSQIAILVDGTVIPCCLDGEGRMALGNIIDQELCQILESERAQKIYNNFTKHRAIEEMCLRCGYRLRF